MTHAELLEKIEDVQFELLKLNEDILNTDVSKERKVQYYELLNKVYYDMYYLCNKVQNDYENDILNEI